MALKLYPVGIQTFERIRKENKLYIDKTEYIYRMTHSGGCYFFLSRPRRFGKSLLVSTFESYFSGKKELFEGLAIEKLEQEWMEYPVLHFDMSGGKHMEKEQLEDYLSNRLEAEERKWGLSIRNLLNNLTRRFAPHNSYFFRRENIELKIRKHSSLFSIQLFSFFLRGYFLLSKE